MSQFTFPLWRSSLLLIFPICAIAPPAAAEAYLLTQLKQQTSDESCPKCLAKTPIAPVRQAQTAPEDDEPNNDEEREDEAEIDLDDDVVEITITATRTRRPVQTTPITIDVFDAEDIERQVVRDIRDLVRYTPGVSVRNSFRYGLQDFNIRGLESNRVLLQVDGIRLPNRFEFGPFQLGRDYVDLDSLGSAEIVRGPASALYGSDALGGVVSFLTPTPGDLLDRLDRDRYFRAGIGGNSVSQGGRATLQHAARFGNLEYAINYIRRDSAGFLINGNEDLRDPQANTRNNVTGKLVYNLGEHQALRLLGEVFDDRRDITAADVNLALYGIDTTTSFTEEVETDRARVSLAYEYDNPDSGGWVQGARVRLYFQDSQTRETNEERRLNIDRRSGTTTPVERTTENEFVDRVFGGDIQLQSDFQLGGIANRLTYGVDLSTTRNERPRDRTQLNLITGDRTRNIPPDTFPTKDFPDTDTLRFGVYLQNEMEFGDSGWSLIPGLRFDAYSLDPTDDDVFERDGAVATDFSDSALTPSLAIGYRPNPNLFLYGRYSRGFRAPLYNEINSGFTNLTSGFFRYRTISNPDLEAETSNSFEVGMRGSGDRYNLSLVGFYNDFDNFIEPFARVGTEPGPDNIPINVFQTQNVSDARTYGVEASAEYRFSPGVEGLSTFARFAWTIGDNRTDDVPLDTVPPLTALLGVRYRGTGDRWGLQTVATYVGQARADDPDPDFRLIRPDPYFLVDLLGYVRFAPNVTLNVGLFNLFDEEYQIYSDVRQLNANSDRDLQIFDRLTQPGRNISAYLVWEF